jgi:isocitrate dehydrogenase
MHYDHINLPADGPPIAANPDHSLNVPDFPIIPFIEGDGIGIDVTPVMLDVLNAAVKIDFGDTPEIKWMQVYAGEKATEIYGQDERLPEETLHAFQRYLVSIKGPLSTPTSDAVIRHMDN